jgi:hypothetical protein
MLPLDAFLALERVATAPQQRCQAELLKPPLQCDIHLLLHSAPEICTAGMRIAGTYSTPVAAHTARTLHSVTVASSTASAGATITHHPSSHACVPCVQAEADAAEESIAASIRLLQRMQQRLVAGREAAHTWKQMLQVQSNRCAFC